MRGEGGGDRGEQSTPVTLGSLPGVCVCIAVCFPRALLQVSEDDDFESAKKSKKGVRKALARAPMPAWPWPSPSRAGVVGQQEKVFFSPMSSGDLELSWRSWCVCSSLATRFLAQTVSASKVKSAGKVTPSKATPTKAAAKAKPAPGANKRVIASQSSGGSAAAAPVKKAKTVASPGAVCAKL